MIAAEDAARLGITERFEPGNQSAVEAASIGMRALGLRHIRIPVSCAEYRSAAGRVWFDWLFDHLGAAFTVLPALQDGAPEVIASLVARHRFEWVELSSAPGSDVIEAAKQGGARVILGHVGAGLKALGEQGVLAAVDGIGLSWAALPAASALARSFNPELALWLTDARCTESLPRFAEAAGAFLDAFDAPVGRVYWCGLWATAPDGGTAAPELLPRLLAKGVGEVRRTLSVARRPPTPAVLGARPVLVTGGAGFIGCNLADRLAAEGHDVLVYDSLARPGVERNLHWLVQRHPTRVNVAIADLRDRDGLAEAATGSAAVFHLAGQVAVTTSLAQPVADFAINLEGTLHLLDALRRGNADAPLIFASTNKVYGDLADIALASSGPAYLPVDASTLDHGVSEARPLCFHTPYGCSKGAADQYVLDYARSFGLRTAVLRMSCIYGERQLGTEDQGWVAHFLLRAMAGEGVTLYGDGKQVRDVLHVGDAVGAYMAAWRNIGAIAGRAYNLGGGPANAISLLQLIDHIGDLLGRPVDVAFADWRQGDQRYFVADTRAIRRDLGLPAPRGWRAGVAGLAAWFGADRPAAGPWHGASPAPAQAAAG